MGKFADFLSGEGDLSDQLDKTSRGMPQKGGGSFGDQWTPPQKVKKEDPVPIVLFKGNYSMLATYGEEEVELKRDWFVMFKHYSNKQKRSVSCSAGLTLVKTGDDRYAVQPGAKDCVPCYHINAETIKGVSCSQQHVFNAIILDWFHLVDSENIDPRTQKPYKDWVACTGKKCKHCKKKNKKRFGRRVFWPMGRRHAKQLAAFQSDTLAKHCKCGGKLQPCAFVCPECESVIRDLEEDEAGQAELSSLRTEVYTCPECNANVHLREEPDCTKCNNPQPLDLWSVVIEPLRIGSGTDSSLTIPEWGLLDNNVKDKIKDLMEPFDFSSGVLRPLGLDKQASIMGLDNPFGDDDDGMVSGSKVWKNEDDEDDEDDE